MFKSIIAKKLSPTQGAVLSNTTFQLVGKLISMTITIVATMIITRVYGNQGFGEFNLMQNYPALFFIIVDFGLNALAVKELSTDFSRASKYLSNLFAFRLLLASILLCLVVFGTVFLPYTPVLKFGISLGMLLLLTQSLFSTANVVFQAKLRYDYSAMGLIAGYLLILVLVILFSYLKLPVYIVNFSYILGGLVTFAVHLNLIRRIFPYKLSLELDLSFLKPLLYASLPLGLMFIFSQINFRIDSLLLSVMKLPEGYYGGGNIESVGLYGLAFKVFEVALVLPTFFMNAVYPIFVQKLSVSLESLLDSVKASVIGLLGLGFLGLVVGYMFSPFAINVLGGSEFSGSVLALRFLVLGLPIFYVTQPLSWLIVTLGRQKYLPGIYLLGALVNVSLNILFIPIYGLYASAVITWISELVILFLLGIYSYKAVKMYKG
jgi:O-antigen/teichoic acid export membrane protein